MNIREINAHLSREILAGWEPQVLRAGRVAVIGGGALGNNVAVALSQSGVGYQLYVDPGFFERSNATRSPLYIENAPKATAVAEGAKRLARQAGNDYTLCEANNYYFEQIDDAALAGIDVLVSAVDTRAARREIAETSLRLGVPMVEAGFRGSSFCYSVFSGKQADPCWRCVNSHPIVKPLVPPGCEQAAVVAQQAGRAAATQTVAQAVGAAVAHEVISLLHRDFGRCGRTVVGDLNDLGRTVVAHANRSALCDAHASAVRASGAIQLTTRSDATLAILLSEVGSRFGDEVLVELPFPFHEVVACPCGARLGVHRPEFAISSHPQCKKCAGETSHWQIVDGESGDDHRLVKVSNPPPALLSMTLHSLGIVHGRSLAIHRYEEAAPVHAVVAPRTLS